MKQSIFYSTTFVALVYSSISIGTTTAFIPSHDAAIHIRTRKTTALDIFKTKRSSDLPKPDPQNPERYLPPPQFSPDSFYPPSLSLFRSGPLPFLTRITSPDKYTQAVYKYMYQSKEKDLDEAQANMDAYFSSPADWAEQKTMEQRGEREVYRYSEAYVDGERSALTVVWAGFIAYVVGKIAYTAVTGGYS